MPDSLFETRRLRVDGQDVDLVWPTSDTSCYSIIAADWADFNPILMSHVRARGVVLQAGGNCGMYPLLHSKQFEYVFTFEPDPVNFYCLSHNCISSKIIKFNTAVGDKAEPLNFGVPAPYNVGMNKVGAGDTVIYSIPIDCLNLPVLALLHLDIEGYELPALRGAEQTIRRCRPVIAVELSQEVEETKQYLKQLDYTEVYSKETNSANYIFIPTEWT